MGAAMTSAVKLYAWAVPAFVQGGSPVDHTWITTFDNRVNNYSNVQAVAAAGQRYWFCWGGYHPSGGTPGNHGGFLGTFHGDSSLANCLVLPNADSRTHNPAKGTIFNYGIDGVCHQLSNQVLYATKTSSRPPLKVSNARGYAASSFLYGDYGLQRSAWANKHKSCSGTVLLGATTMANRQDSFTRRAASALTSEPGLLRQLLNMRDEAQEFASKRPLGTSLSAEAINNRNQQFLNEAAKLLGRDRFRAIFGLEPDETINLVDPNLFREQNTQHKPLMDGGNGEKSGDQ